jgi:hypothetical protein
MITCLRPFLQDNNIHFITSIQLGNNGFKVRGTKLLTVPSYKRVYVDRYNRNPNGTYRFNDSIAGAPSRPYGTEFEGSLVAYKLTNVLVVRSALQ